MTVSLEPLSIAQWVTFVLLALTVVVACLGSKAWWAAIAAATIAGYCAQVVSPLGIVWVVVMLGVSWMGAQASPAQSTIIKLAAAIGVIVVALLLGLHWLPGFANPIIIRAAQFSADAEPFTLYLNFDKTVAGVAIIGLCAPQFERFATLNRQPVMTATQLAAVLVSIVVALIFASYVLGYVHFDPKWTSTFWVWAAVNLFFVCFAEEVFFRGFILCKLVETFHRSQHAERFALIVSATLFGVAHIAGGWRYAALATLAGVGYGYVYLRTRRIEWSIAAHFLLNTTHFLLFTYPRLA